MKSFAPFINLQRRQGRIMLIAGCVLALIAILSISMLAWTRNELLLGIACAIGPLCAIGALLSFVQSGLSYAKGRRFERDEAMYERGKYLVHWQLPADEWQRFLDGLQKKHWVGIKLFCSIIFGLGLFFALMMGVLEGIEPAFGVLAISLILTAITFLLIRCWSSDRMKLLGSQPGGCLIAEESAYCGGLHTCWGTSDRTLCQVVFVEESPAFLSFILNQQIDPTGLGRGLAATSMPYRAVSTTGYQWFAIPVPAGQEEEALEVAQHMNERIRHPSRLAW